MLYSELDVAVKDLNSFMQEHFERRDDYINQYLMWKYNVDLAKFVNNTNNLKLKCNNIRCVVQGKVETWVDGDKVFLTITDDITDAISNSWYVYTQHAEMLPNSYTYRLHWKEK